MTDLLSKYVKQSILCWVATADSSGQPNVSPKEVFDVWEENALIIANIASPQTVNNIRQNEKVCISLIDVFLQKGIQLKGVANIIENSDDRFSQIKEKLHKQTNGKFPFVSATLFIIQSYKEILAPSYLLYPETSELDQIATARRQYNDVKRS